MRRWRCLEPWPSLSKRRRSRRGRRRTSETFLAAVAEHRWAVGFQLGVLYGLRRSEVLALRVGPTSIPRAAHFESTRASSQSTAVPFWAMPRTCAHVGSFLCPTTGCARSQADAAPS